MSVGVTPAQVVTPGTDTTKGVASTETVFVTLQFGGLVPVTEYVAVTPGTVIDGPVCPLLQLYEVAPLADRFVDIPGQAVTLDTERFGGAITTTVACAELSHPG